MDESVLSQGTESVQETNEIDTTLQSEDVSLDGQDGTGQESMSTWDQDKRYSDMWKGDPNNLYRSYTHIEKMLPTVQNEVKTYREQVEEYKRKHEENEGRISELSQFKSVFDSIEQNPLYKEKVLQAIQEAKEEETRIKYPNLPAEAIKQLQQGEQLAQELRQMKEEKAREQATIAIDTTLSKIDGIAQKYGIEYNQVELLNAANQNGIPPQFLEMYFMHKAADMIADIKSRNAQMAVSKQSDSNKQKSIPASPTRPKPTTSPSLQEKMMAALNRK